MYSLVVRGSSIGTKNFESLYVGVPMADKIGLKVGRPSVTILWTLAKPYIIPGLEAEGLLSILIKEIKQICYLKYFESNCNNIKNT